MTADLQETDGTPSAALPPEGEPTGSRAPYMSFGGLKNLIEKLQKDGIPQRFDGSFFGNQSGSLTAQVRGSLRYFDLIDDEKQPTQLLRELVSADEPGRIQILRGMAEAKFADAIALGQTNGTKGQLEQVFRSRGLNGATVTKAVAFYLGLAEYTGLPVSSYFKKGRVSSGAGGTRKAPKKRVGNQAVVAHGPLPPATTTSVEAKKGAYIDMLMKLAEISAEKGEVQTGLLDRIERALGFEPTPSVKEGA